MTLKMYVWPKYAPDYTNELAVAIAESADDARDAIEKIEGYRDPSLAGRPTEYPLDRPMACCAAGGG